MRGLGPCPSNPTKSLGHDLPSHLQDLPLLRSYLFKQNQSIRFMDPWA